MPGPAKYEDYADHFSPLEVEVTGSFEDALRRFKSTVQRSRILAELKERQHYTKPSAKKRKKRRDAEEKARLNAIREKQTPSDK